ncbi:MAG TPA: hypothetical protein PKC28_02360 [Bdellovibrionales bacterium]|nr:hypothetical protein [Bdellovibrionales bacterium]
MPELARVFLGLVLFCALPARAGTGGAYVGSGGMVVDCAATAKEPPRIEALEYWIARMSRGGDGSSPQELRRFEELSTRAELHDFFREKTARAGWFDHRLEYYRQLLNWDEPIVVSHPLLDTDDDGYFTELPANCEIKQAVVRRSSRLYWAESIRDRLDFRQRAILEMHELVYMVGVEQYRHVTSGKTQDLIVLLLTADPAGAELSRYLSSMFVR